MKRRFEEARSGLQICRRRTKKKKEKRFDEDEETQQMKKPRKMKKPRTKNNLTMKTKKGETRVFKTRVLLGFLSTIPYKSRLKNSIFILELEFLELEFQTLEMLVFNIVLQRDNQLNFFIFNVIWKKNSTSRLHTPSFKPHNSRCGSLSQNLHRPTWDYIDRI